MKKLILLYIIAAFFIFFGVSFASGTVTQGYHEITIDDVGPLFSEIILKGDAVDGSFENEWFILNKTEANKLLAVALTGMSADSKIIIWVSDDPHPFAGITVRTIFGMRAVK
jgi:hypothetical protein